MRLALGLGLSSGRRPAVGGSVPPVTPPGGGGGGGSGGFEGHETPPTVEVVNDTVVVQGKTKAGFIGRFVVPLGALVAGRAYDVNVVADFSGLALGGAKAGLGFGFKTDNNFRLVLLQGNAGTTRVATIRGTPPNGWNKQTGHTVTSGGSPENGTQHAMDIRLVVNGDGTAYDFSTSGDGQETWDEELADQPFTPFAHITAIDSGIGIAGYFATDDYGTYTVTVTWVEVAEAAEHRYWRILITDTSHAANDVANILEMQMHAGNTGFEDDECEGGTPTADSELTPGYAASNGFDGALFDTGAGSNEAWASTDSAFPHWLRYDFGAGNDVAVRGVSLLSFFVNTSNVEGMPRDFAIQYSDDGSAWTTEWSETGVTFSGYQLRHFLHPDVASYTGSPHGSHTHWRMRLLRDDGGTISSATEIEMRATPGGADQCTGGAPISNGETAGLVDDNAFDNNNATFFASTTTSNLSYIGYAFASPVSVAQITWRNRQDSDANQSPTHMVVEYADNGAGPWTMAWSVIGQTGWTLAQTRTFTDPNYI